MVEAHREDVEAAAAATPTARLDWRQGGEREGHTGFLRGEGWRRGRNSEEGGHGGLLRQATSGRS
jgi:hypothetical protein